MSAAAQRLARGGRRLHFGMMDVWRFASGSVTLTDDDGRTWRRWTMPPDATDDEVVAAADAVLARYEARLRSPGPRQDVSSAAAAGSPGRAIRPDVRPRGLTATPAVEQDHDHDGPSLGPHTPGGSTMSTVPPVPVRPTPGTLEGPALVSAVLDALTDAAPAHLTGALAGVGHHVTRDTLVAVQPLVEAYTRERQSARIIAADRRALASDLIDTRAALDRVTESVEALARTLAECEVTADGEAVEAYVVLSRHVSALVAAHAGTTGGASA